MGRKTINIINFVRGVEPREDIDLIKPVELELLEAEKRGIKSTFLLQYDALIKSEFTNIFSNAKLAQKGIWIEIVKPLCKEVEIEWRGRYDWDWNVNPGFLIAYTQEQRMLLIDELFLKFKSVFGNYPKVAGSWMLDSFSMNYMNEKYGMDAYCICRDQWGTDGYTLWGGYYNQGYYPSKSNMLQPAQTKMQQINVPVFRMLGSDPIYQYDCVDSNADKKMQGVATMEPVGECGKSKTWVEWYFKNMIENEDLGFSYLQIGQENSFGFDRILQGYTMQLDIIQKLCKEQSVNVETLGETGKWFKSTYEMTPPTVISANDEVCKSIWYNCKYYRINILENSGMLWIRDLHIFSENLEDKYLYMPCMKNSCVYETMPIMDGYNWSTKNISAGIYFVGKTVVKRQYECDGGLNIDALYNGFNTQISLRENAVTIESETDVELNFSMNPEMDDTKIIFEERKIKFYKDKEKYFLSLDIGKIKNEKIVSENNKIAFDLVLR